MKFNIEHHTRFAFNKLVGYTIQQLRLTPQDGFGQRVNNWQLKVSGLSSTQTDAFGNITHTLVKDAPHQEIMIIATGEVETDLDSSEDLLETNKIKHDDLALPIYLRNTSLTIANEAIIKFAQNIASQHDTINQNLLTALMDGVSQTIKWDKTTAENQQSAISTFAAGKALSQGMTHLFISCCRALKIPARLVHGYCFNPATKQIENHSWADAWLLETGWQSFDIANNMPSNGIHIRLATGLDYRDACPVSSVMHDIANDKMSVDFKVHEISQMQQ
ncbi:MAG: transglutaminase family protein [Methylotenera sp.]|uniref:transglutaminase family protein n=1 Tax=Methylotenera sp. TaxID=2051956 RepID=UPI0024883284|nr:transglutaminase family protein [Methylotenera sp.]MDI1308997.1 transglutaminase family protein [Methylotenera sp.]